MSKACWLVFASLTLGLGSALLSACGSGGDRPGSLVGGGESGHGGGSAGHAGGSSGEAGQTAGDGGNEASGEDAGAAGETSSPAMPIAIFPKQLQVDVGCASSGEPTELVIRNGGLLPLSISSAKATAGYVLKTELPLQIEAMSSAALLVTPPEPKATASVGDMSTGTLSFVTNEADGANHEVLLNTTLFGGLIEFTDGSGGPLSGPLPLTYLSSDTCPDSVRYRVYNSGNLAFKLLGPTFPLHFAGTSTAKSGSGRSVAPNEYVELTVSGSSAPDGACSGSGTLSFTVQGSFCGEVPKLSVTWPSNVATAGCACTASSD